MTLDYKATHFSLTFKRVDPTGVHHLFMKIACVYVNIAYSVLSFPKILPNEIFGVSSETSAPSVDSLTLTVSLESPGKLVTSGDLRVCALNLKKQTKPSVTLPSTSFQALNYQLKENLLKQLLVKIFLFTPCIALSSEQSILILLY